MKVEIKIKKNEFDEYEVRWIEDGIKNEAKTCYTDDKEDAELTKGAMEKEAKKQMDAEASLDKASQMSKAELFLRELQAEDEDDYNVVRDRVAAIVEELGMEAAIPSIYELYSLTNKIEGRYETAKSWDGYTIPKSCQDNNKECGKCYLEKEARTKIGCTVPID